MFLARLFFIPKYHVVQSVSLKITPIIKVESMALSKHRMTSDNQMLAKLLLHFRILRSKSDSCDLQLTVQSEETLINIRKNFKLSRQSCGLELVFIL